MHQLCCVQWVGAPRPWQGSVPSCSASSGSLGCSESEPSSRGTGRPYPQCLAGPILELECPLHSSKWGWGLRGEGTCGTPIWAPRGQGPLPVCQHCPGHRAGLAPRGPSLPHQDVLFPPRLLSEPSPLCVHPDATVVATQTTSRHQFECPQDNTSMVCPCVCPASVGPAADAALSAVLHVCTGGQQWGAQGGKAL